MAYTYLYKLCKENIEKNGDAPVSDPVMQKEMANFEFFEPAYKAYRDHFKEFYDTGVTVLAGTDMVMYHSPFLPLPRELQYMVEYGITPVQAVQVATSNPAKVLGVEKESLKTASVMLEQGICLCKKRLLRCRGFLHVKITCRKFNKIRENLSKTVAYCIKSKYNIHGRKFDLIIKFIKMEG